MSPSSTTGVGASLRKLALSFRRLVAAILVGWASDWTPGRDLKTLGAILTLLKAMDADAGNYE